MVLRGSVDLTPTTQQITLLRRASTNAATRHILRQMALHGSYSYYQISFGYNAPYEDTPHLRLNAPNRFLHLVLLGGTVDLHGPSWPLTPDPPYHPPATNLGKRTLGGKTGTLYYLTPRSESLFSGHLTFVWHQGPWTYVASMHAWTPLAGATAFLAAIIGHMKPTR